MSGRTVRRSLLVLLMLAFVAFAWAGFRAYQVQRDLRAAVDDATVLQAAVEAGDETSSDAALDELRDHSRSAADKSHGLSWSLLTHLPAVGDDARGVQTVSDVISDLAEDGLAPLTDSANKLDQLVPSGGRIDLATLVSLRAPVRQGGEAFASADARLAEVDAEGFVGLLQDRYVDMADRVDTVAHQLSAADTALEVMPSMLGANGPRNYLLVVQNNAEVRATGGLPGSVSLLNAREGKVRITKQVPGGKLSASPGQELDITGTERTIYSELLGTYFLDANFTPDFPRAADLMRQYWELSQPEQVDGVLTIDPVTLSYILGAVGPVTVDGVMLSADNAVDELLHGVYLRISDPQKQDAFFQDAAQAVFDRVTAGAPSPESLLRALSRGVSEHRVLVHAFDDSVQGPLATRTIAGAFVTDPEADPQVGFFVNDTTGAKMSYYLRYAPQVQAVSCQGGRQQYEASAQLVSDAPKDVASQPDYVTGGGAFGTAPGKQLTTYRIYGPVNGTITDMTFDGKPLDFLDYVQGGRPVAVFVAELAPGQQTDVTWKMETGDEQTGDTNFSVTPGVAPTNLSKSVPSAC